MGRINKIKNITYQVPGNAKKSFITSCHFLIIDAYRSLESGKYSADWEEETFSAILKNEIEKICDEKQLPYHITREYVQDTFDILQGSVKAKRAKKIDIVFASFIVAKKLIYGIEAKILVENDIKTRKFSSLNSEYIYEGINRYVNGIYKIDGCMIGYVVEGEPDNIVIKINNLLRKYNRIEELIGSKFSLNGFNYCYNSSHSGLTLSHFLLPLRKRN